MLHQSLEIGFKHYQINTKQLQLNQAELKNTSN